MTNATTITAALEIIKAVGDCIRELKEIPSGHLYARLMGAMSLERYESVITILVKSKLVKNEGHLLTWIGPA